VLKEEVVGMQGICTCLQCLCAVTPSTDSHGLNRSKKIKAAGIAVAEAGARLTCRLLDFRESPQSQSEHACALVAAPLAVLSASSQNTSPHHDQQYKVCLAILSTIIRFLEDPSSSSVHHQSCVTAAIEKTWPVLQALANSPLAQKTVVTSGVSEVVSAAFSAAGDQRGVLIGPSCELLQKLVTANVSAAPLESAAKLAELSGEGSGISLEQQGLLHQGLVGFVQVVHTALSPPNTSQPDVIAAMMKLLTNWMLFHTVAFLEGALVDSALAVATSAACMREKDVVSNALGFINLLMTPSRMLRMLAKKHAEQEAADSMVCALLSSVCDQCPMEYQGSMGRALFNLLTSAASSQQAMPAAQRELMTGVFVQKVCHKTRLTQNDCQRFAALCLKADALQQHRFTSAVVDFAKIAHGLGDSDSLLAYEM
jgi:hypothetical protein